MRVIRDDNIREFREYNENFEMFNRTITSLNDGYSVVYDATNINRKHRIELLDKLSREYKEPLRKRAYLSWGQDNQLVSRL